MNKSAILLGSKPGSVAALMMLVDRGWTVKEVVASPEQASWLPKPSLYDSAKMLGIRTVDDQSHLECEDVDLVISFMFRSLVHKSTLKRGKYPLNFHAGPLPEFGGWAFYNLAILEDSSEYGCTCHIMDEGFDTGPLVKVRRFLINPSVETALSLERKAQTEMLLLFREVISAYEVSATIDSEPQDPAKMRYLSADQFRKLKQIPTDASTSEIDRIARAFWYPPYEMAFYLLPNGNRLEVIPEIAKVSLATHYHLRDLEDLFNTADITSSLRGLMSRYGKLD